MSVNVKTARKIGLLTAVSIFISSLIGIGIFFKNNTVFKENNNNPYGILISWIVASIISLLTAFSFAEVGFNHRDGAGLAGAAERMYGKKIGRFISFNNVFFYWTVLDVSISIFCAESLIKLFYINDDSIPQSFHMGYVMLIALGLMFMFVTLNYLSLKWSGRLQVTTTVLKFIPLIAVGIAGISFGIMNSATSLFNPEVIANNNPDLVVGSISVEGILAAIPSILFAYDSFTGVSSLKRDLKNPKKNVPLTIVLGMSICVMFYMFITIGQMMVGQGTAQNVFDVIFKDDATMKQVFTILISVFIFISVIGTLNALLLVSLRTMTYSVENRIVYGYWWLAKYVDGTNKPGYILSILLHAIVWGLLLIPSVILNSDAIIDGASNFPTLFMFAVYATLILKAWINRFKPDVHGDKMPGFKYLAPVAVLGCYLAFGYQFFWNYSTRIFISIATNTQLENYKWGLFCNDGNGIAPQFAAITFFVMLIIFIVLPFINDEFIKLKYNSNKNNKYLLNELIV